MSQYTASLPSDGSVKSEVQQYYERFYEISDTPSDHEKYADFFTADGKLIMGPNAVQGRDEIIKMRHSMWEKVAKRSHKPQQIYAFGLASDEYMLHGSVGYELKDGKSTSTEWAGRAHFVKEGDVLKMDFYQVYLDTGAMARAK